MIFHGKRHDDLLGLEHCQQWNNEPTQTLDISLEVYDHNDITSILKQDICILIKQESLIKC